MSEHGDSGSSEVPGVPPDMTDDGSVETYETDSGTVLYDARNPLAWIESSFAIPIDEAV